MGEFISVFSTIFKFRLLWLLCFMDLYMLCRKIKNGLNMILPWFVLHLVL